VRAALPLALAVLAACSHTPRARRDLPTARPVQPAQLLVEAPPAASGLAGIWREYWGIEGQTDVTYHDEYRIWFEDGRPHLEPLSQAHPDDILSVDLDGEWLDFRLRTSFEIHYRLQLSSDGQTLTGTAQTPSLRETVRWERVEHPSPAEPDEVDETEVYPAP